MAKLLRNLFLCTLLLGLFSVFFFVDAPEAKAVPELGSNCAQCHGEGFGGSGDSGASDETSGASAEGGEHAEGTDETSGASAEGGDHAEGTDETSGASAEHAEEEPVAEEPVDEGMKGIPLVVGGLVFVAGVTGLASVVKRK